MGTAAWVTPRLFVGNELSLPHVTATSAHSAAQLVRDGETVLVPSWDVAEPALRILGADEDHIAWVHSQVSQAL